MSDYKFEFGVATRHMGSDVTEVVDLIEDGYFAEVELDGKTDDQILDMLDEPLQEFVWENIDSWVKRV